MGGKNIAEWVSKNKKGGGDEKQEEKEEFEPGEGYAVCQLQFLFYALVSAG